MYDLIGAPSASPWPSAVLAWYDRNRRVLPWRALPGEAADPYVVWLSEIMLQQTTVATVGPYFAAFVSRWPRVSDLAAAPLDEVLRRWAGLGYYSRARNLHATAEIVATELGGRFPETETELRRLPGIGPYTAAAISAIAFGRRAVVVDGNVERVIARFFAIEAELPAARSEIEAKAGELTPRERPGDYAQAMMDLGATTCTPRKPLCPVCPLSFDCAARAVGAPESYPRKAPKEPRPFRRGTVFFTRRADGFVLVRSRPPKGLLGGMTEFPGTAWIVAREEEAQVRTASRMREAPVPVPYRELDERVAHVFTHFRLELVIFVGSVARGHGAPTGCRWVPEEDLDREALPTLMRKVLEVVRATETLHRTG